jgi:hypothetical protein
MASPNSQHFSRQDFFEPTTNTATQNDGAANASWLCPHGIEPCSERTHHESLVQVPEPGPAYSPSEDALDNDEIAMSLRQWIEIPT